MKHFFLVLIGILILCRVSAAKDEPTFIKADHITYDEAITTYIAKGNCEIKKDKHVLKADEAIYNKTNGVVQLYGNVQIYDNEGDWVKGPKAVINIDTFKGFADNAVCFVAKNHLYIKAKRIILDDKNHYYASDTTITGCDCPECLSFDTKYAPEWSIHAKNTYIVKNNYVFSYPLWFNIGKVPVFVFPAIEEPLVRKSGFLFPSFGYSKTNGFKYYQPYYWAINKSQDATFTSQYDGKIGYGLNTQYRYYWTDNIKGQWDIELFKDTTPPAGDIKRTRLNLDITQNADFKKYGDLKADIHYLSNKNNLRVINDDNMQLTSNRYTSSKLMYALQNGPYFLDINNYFYQNLVASNNSQTLQKLPEVFMGATNLDIYKKLSLDISSLYSYNYRQDGLRGNVLDISPSFSYPFKIGFINFLPKAGIHYLFSNYSNGLTGSQSSVVPNLSLTARTSFFKIYDLSSGNSYKHIIAPEVSYTFVPKVKQEFPDFVNTYPQKSALDLTLENTIIKRTVNDKGEADYREIFYNKITQEYRFANYANTPIKPIDSRETYMSPRYVYSNGPIYEETRISPFSFFNFSSQAYYQWQKHTFTYTTDNLNFNFNTFGFSIGYTTAKDPDFNTTSNGITYSVFFYPIKRLYTYISLNRDILDSYFPQKRAGFYYTSDCWGFGLDVFQNAVPQQVGNTYIANKNVGFWITLSLRGIGVFKKR
ncbi:LPS-assembly protein LptD [Desulfurella sp.]|uniref:LPS-assembly protein LptD n=1 Tax=Desulfurella sp. TaxID=1962857 RepID=UPI0025C04601|nr:LptA/OstA family protein [Desulfurella sp.]